MLSKAKGPNVTQAKDDAWNPKVNRLGYVGKVRVGCD
jgi:hypothetical protein